MKRETRVLLAYSFVSSMGGGIFWPFLGIHLYDLGASYFQIALLDSLSAIMYVVSRLWGAASDYYGLRKPFIIFGSVLSAVPVLLCSFVYEPNHVIALFMMSSFFSSISFPSFLAALTSIKEKGKVLGWYSMLSSIGWSVGCFFMGFLHQFQGVLGVFASSSALIVLSTLIIVSYPRESGVLRDESLWSYTKTALTFKFKAPTEFKWLLLSVFLGWFGLQWSGPLIRMRMYDLLERSKIAFGIVWGLSASTSSSVASLLAGRLADKVGGGRVLQATILIYALYLPIFAYVSDPIVYSILWIIPVWTFYWVGTLSTPAQMTHESVRGEAMGALNSALNLGVFLGAVGGLFADKFGWEVGIVITPIFFVAAFAPLWPVARFYRKRPT